MLRTEIGSEFWSAPIREEENNLFPETTRWFISGRSALSYIIRDIRSKQDFCTVAMPSWCCESMIAPFLRQGIDVKFYSVTTSDGRIVIDTLGAEDCDALFVLDYFGYKSCVDYSNFNGVVIRDVTHSLFCSEHSYADYYFGSLRKWCGIPTGGFVYANDGFSSDLVINKPNPSYLLLRTEAMESKALYISGMSDDKGYLSLFSRAEKMLDECSQIEQAALEDVAIAKRLDVDTIVNARRRNAKILLTGLSKFALFPEINEHDCPLFVPILVPNKKRDDLRRYLVEKEIYCPIHWPISSLHVLDEKTRKLYDEELSIVCDQRYGVADMKRICQEIQKFMWG